MAAALTSTGRGGQALPPALLVAVTISVVGLVIQAVLLLVALLAVLLVVLVGVVSMSMPALAPAVVACRFRLPLLLHERPPI